MRCCQSCKHANWDSDGECWMFEGCNREKELSEIEKAYAGDYNLAGGCSCYEDYPLNPDKV